MDAPAEAPLPEAGRRPRRWWRWCLAAALGVPLVLFGLSNLWLATPPGRARVAGVFQRLTGLEARVGPVTWSPWGGITLRRIELLAPEALRGSMAEPLVAVERVRVRPFWRPLGKGMLMFRSVDVERPRLLLPVELLSHLASRQPAVVVPVPEAGDALAALPPGGGPGAGGGSGAVPGPAPAAPGGAGPAVPEGAGPPPTVAVPPDPRPTVWVRVRGASIWLGQVGSGRGWGELADLSADVPIGGQAAGGKIVAGSWKVAGRELGATEVPVAWAPPVLVVGPWIPRWDGLRGELNVRVIPAGPLPFMVDCKLPAQELARQEWAGVGHAAARQCEVEAKAGGYLRAPATWQGELRARALGLSGARPGGGFSFDESILWVLVRNGILTVRDLRGVGERFSLLGNALVFADGRVAGNGRLVVPPDAALALQQRFGSMLPPVGSGLRPLETPDRWVLDARVGGTMAEPWVEFGDGPTLRARRLLEEMKDDPRAGQ